MEKAMSTDYESVQPGLLDRRAVCEMFGGTKPINPSTLYRGIKLGRYPKPIHIGGSSRWLASECREVLRRIDGGPVMTKRRRRKCADRTMIIQDGGDGLVYWLEVPEGMTDDEAVATQEWHGPYKNDPEAAEDFFAVVLGPAIRWRS
jgi:predicted DNA-binding transcriptional regulator AlpA